MTNMDQEREGAITPKTRTPPGGPNQQQEHAHHYSNNKQQMQIQPDFGSGTSITPNPTCKNEKIKLREVNAYLTCLLCKGYLIDATTISECLHSFCRSCIIKFLQDNSHCPECELGINKAKPNLKLDKTLQDIVYKLVPEVYLNEMTRRRQFYGNHPEKTGHLSPEQRGDDTERIIFNARDKFSLSLEYICDDTTPGDILLPPNTNNEGITNAAIDCNKDAENMRRYLQCPGMCRVDVLKKFVRNKYNVDTNSFHIDILYKRVPLPDHYTLIDIAYIYSWKRNEPMKFFFRITDIKQVRNRFDFYERIETPHPAPKTVLLTPISQVSSHEQKATKPLVKKPKSVRFHNEDEFIKAPAASSTPIRYVKSDKSDKDKSANDMSKVIKQPLDTSDINEQTVKKPRPNFDNSATNAIVREDTPLKDIPKKTLLLCLKTNFNEPSKSKHKKLAKLHHSNNIHSNSASHKSSDKNHDKKMPVAPKTVTKPKVVPRFETEKERFLKYVQLQAVSNETSVNKVNQNQSQRSPSSKNKSPKVHGLKRKIPSPHKNGQTDKLKVKKPKLISKKKSPKALQNSDSILNTTKPKSDTEPNLKNLLNTCKIPSSLSITCVNGGDRETQIKPVINHIEILKLPEVTIEGKNKSSANPPTNTVEAKAKNKAKEDKPASDAEKLEKVGTTVKLQTQDETIAAKAKNDESKDPAKSELSITITVEKSKTDSQAGVGVHPNLPMILQANPALRPMSSFQKMFEDTLKKRNEALAAAAKEAKEQGKTIEKVEKPEAINNGNEKVDEKNANSKRNILEIASQLYKKTKLEQDLKQQDEEANLVTNAEGKVAIPRLKKSTPCESIQNLHSNTLSMNYSVSVTQQKQSANKQTRDENVVTSTTKIDIPPVSTVASCNTKMQELNISVKSPRASPNFHLKPSPSPEIKVSSSSPSPSLPTPKQKQKLPSPTSSSQASSKAPKPLITVRPAPPNHVGTSSKVRSHMPRPPSLAPKLPSPRIGFSPLAAPSPLMNRPMPPLITNNIPAHVHNIQNNLLASLMPPNANTKLPSPKPAHIHSPKASKSPLPTAPSPMGNLMNPMEKDKPKLDANQLQEKYNLQNLAQLSASFNFPGAFGQPPNPLATIQQAMFLNLEMQNRQNWLNMSSNLVQYDKFLQSLNAASKNAQNGQNHLLTKEN